MDEYIIENRNGDDYITAIKGGFTLKVIPPEKQDEDKEYPPYQAVTAISEHILHIEPAPWMLDENIPMPEDWETPGEPSYDFVGLDISFQDDDVPNCNKQIWLDAINFYCQLKLDRPIIDLVPYNYNYELGEHNFTPETFENLSSKPSDE